MSESIHTIDEPLPPAQLLRVNDVCDRFEAAWKATPPGAPGPSIEEALGSATGPERAALLRYLVLLDIDYRRLRGAAPTPADYRGRFPDLPSRFFDERSAPAPAAPPEVVDPIFDAETTVNPPAFQPQMRSDRYVIQRFHARGGIGEVWMARDGEIGRQVALKRLRKKREDQRERFLAEAQITGQLEHPGIVPVHDLGIDESGEAFYVMSFIHGRPLREAIDEYHAAGSSSAEAREVQFSRLLEAFIKVCHAVAYAHHRGVIHRDLKPDNVMLGPFGEVLVLDWGMAKVLNLPERPPGVEPVQPTYSSGSGETREGSVMGSPAYMAPEMAEGHAARADERTDVYLLGATLYHLLTGRAPRQGASHEEVVELARTTPPPSPRRVKADVPRALEAVCLKAMALRPADRYGGARALADDMERYLAGAPVSAYREPLLVRARRWCKRHRQALERSLVAAVLLGLAVAGVLVLHDARKQAEELGRQAEERRRQAERLERRERAGADLKEFRRLSDERQFHGSQASVIDESSALYHDPRLGREAGEKALALGNRLLPETGELDMPEEHGALQKEYDDLVLLTAHGAGKAAPARAIEAGPATALGHFLEGEDCRVRAHSPTDSVQDALGWRPSPGLLREAVEHYRKALALEPDYFWCHLQLGRCYLGLGMGSEALGALDAAVALRPKAPWGYTVRAWAQILMKHYAEADADLDHVLAREPTFQRARLYRGVIGWLQREDDKALEEFAAVLEKAEGERLIEAAYYRGQLHLQRKEFPKALKDFDALIKEKEQFRPVYLNRAQVHFLRGDKDGGMADLTRFLDLGVSRPFDPRDPQLFAQRGRLLLQLVSRWGLTRADRTVGLKRARDELEAAREGGQHSAELFDDLGSVNQKLHEPLKALAYYEKALETAKPELTVKVRTKRGWIFAAEFGKPKTDPARDEFAAAIRLDGTHADAHAGLGYVRAWQGAVGEAQRAAANALLRGSDEYLLLNNVACIYAVLADTDKAQAARHQDMAMDLLRRSVELAGRKGKQDKAQELENIAGDRTFDGLRGRKDYRELLDGGGK